MTDAAGVVLARQPMVDSDFWRDMRMLPPQQRPVLVYRGDYLTAALFVDPGLVAACVRSREMGGPQ